MRYTRGSKADDARSTMAKKNQNFNKRQDKRQTVRQVARAATPKAKASPVKKTLPLDTSRPMSKPKSSKATSNYPLQRPKKK
jgi:hypothetical protein